MESGFNKWLNKNYFVRGMDKKTIEYMEDAFNAGKNSIPIEPPVMQKIAGDHKQLKEEGWQEWLDANDLHGATPLQTDMIRSAYDYGWYYAYGLQSEDKRHSEVMEMLKKLQMKVKSNFSA